MFSEQLKKILAVAKKTGDRVIIFDASDPDSAFVITDFDSYAKSLGGEVEAVAAPREKPVSEPVKEDLSPKKTVTKELTEEDLTDKINREISNWKNRDVSSFLNEENKHKSGWQIPPTVKKKAQEVE